jgi:hypothetical protein
MRLKTAGPGASSVRPLEYGREIHQNGSGGASDCSAAPLWHKNRRMAKTAEPITSRTNSTPTHDEIAAHAYQIYLREGCLEGRDMEHWLQAEAELRQRTNGNGHLQTAREQTATPQAPAASTAPKKEPPQTLPNSVVPPSAPIAQVSRNTTPRRTSGKREAAAAK